MPTSAALKNLQALRGHLEPKKLDKLGDDELRALCGSLLKLLTVLPTAFDRLPDETKAAAMPEELAKTVLPHLLNDALPAALEDLDESVRASEQSANQILEASEKLMEVSETLGDKGAEVSDIALTIMEACNFQDLTGQRVTRVKQVLETTRDAFTQSGAAAKTAEGANPFEGVYDKGPVNNGQDLDQAAADALFDT